MQSGVCRLLEGSSSAPSQWPVDTLLAGDFPFSQNLSSKGVVQRTTLLTQAEDLPDICTEGQCGMSFESHNNQSHAGSPKNYCLSCELFTNSSAHWHDLNSGCYF